MVLNSHLFRVSKDAAATAAKINPAALSASVRTASSGISSSCAMAAVKNATIVGLVKVMTTTTTLPT
jgi:hypothetical protein